MLLTFQMFWKLTLNLSRPITLIVTLQVNQCLEDIVSKCDTISNELDKLKDKLVSFPNQATVQSDCYGSHNHSKLKKWSKPYIKIYRSMTFYRLDLKSKTSIAPKAIGIKTRSGQPSQPCSLSI